MFSQTMNELMYRLRPLREFRLFTSETADGIEPAAREAVCQSAERMLRTEAPLPTLNDIMLRPGSAAEKIRAALRSLNTLTLAAALTGTDRYTEKIADLSYALMEKSVWSEPDGKVPGSFICVTDVMAADIAETLAWTNYLMRRAFNTKYPGLSDRIETEISYRITERLLTHDEYETYLKTLDGYTVAVLSRVLPAVLISDSNDQRRWDAVRAILKLLDISLQRMQPDGASTQGLEGWLQESVPLMDAVQMLYLCTDQLIDHRTDTPLKLMAEYPVNAHMGKGFFANPDGSIEPYLPGSALFRFGFFCASKTLTALGAYLNREFPDREEITSTGRFFRLILYRDLMREAALAPERPGVRMPVTQLATARGEGFACALHGGSLTARRADAGDVLITYRGRPILTDLGAEAHSAEMHSLPIIGSFSVQKGHGGADDFDARFEQNYAQLSANLRKAYLRESGVISWERTVMLSRFEKSVRIVEAFDLAAPVDRICFRIITPIRPEPVGDSFILGPVAMRAEGPADVTIESLSTGYRITFCTTVPMKKGNFSFVFTPAGQ